MYVSLLLLRLKDIVIIKNRFIDRNLQNVIFNKICKIESK